MKIDPEKKGLKILVISNSFVPDRDSRND